MKDQKRMMFAPKPVARIQQNQQEPVQQPKNPKPLSAARPARKQTQFELTNPVQQMDATTSVMRQQIITGEALRANHPVNLPFQEHQEVLSIQHVESQLKLQNDAETAPQIGQMTLVQLPQPIPSRIALQKQADGLLQVGSGLFGTVVEYRSGRKALRIEGGVELELFGGQRVDCFQQLVVVDPQHKIAQNVGCVDAKLVASVRMEEQ